MKQYPLDQAFLVSVWLEALTYGFFLCLFCASLYVNITLRRSQDSHSKVMFGAGILMFVIATLHLAMNLYRTIKGFIELRNGPGGPLGYLGNLAPWDHVFKDTLYATQEILGDCVAVYRTYVIWGRDWRPIVIPGLLLVMSFVSGYSVCGLYPTEPNGQTVFDPRLLRWIETFYAISVVQSGITTFLMAFRLYRINRRSASYRTGKGNLLPALRILVESASIQFATELVLLALYLANYNAQYILLEIVTPMVGITFNAITIRIALRAQAGRSTGSQAASSSHGRVVTENQVATIGSIPMRHIAINITKDVEDHQDDHSGSYHGEYDKGRSGVPKV